MKTKTIWKLHSWLGLLAGIPLLVIALSGSLLVFKDDLNRLLIPGKVFVESRPEGPLPMAERLAALQEGLPEHEVVGWALYDEPERSDWVYVMAHGDDEWLHVYQNPYTGEILGEPVASDSEFMGWLLELHYTFLAGHVGMAVCGVLAILLCLLGLTGFLIYRKFWKSFFTFRWRTSLRLLGGNLHKRVGVVSAPVFLILGITGAVWNIDHVLHELEHIAEDGGDHEHYKMAERLYADELPLDAMRAASREAIPGFQVNYISFPWEPGVDITFWGSFEGQSSLRGPYHSTVAFDARSGDYLRHSRIDEASVWKQTYDAFEPLHFGTFGGLVTKVFWCVLGAAPGFLAVTGCLVWWKRR
ncbi:MAG: PepSY-associated TM helix domain-containing protein [Opitutales bacterium]